MHNKQPIAVPSKNNTYTAHRMCPPITAHRLYCYCTNIHSWHRVHTNTS